MSPAAPRLELSIRTHLAPLLKEDSFKGSRRNFRRIINGWIQVVNIQGSPHGGQFAINLGMHPIGASDVLGNPPNPKTITEPLCHFRRRLSEAGEDQWWQHRPSQDSMDSAVQSAAIVYTRLGRRLFNCASSPDSPLDRISPADLQNSGFAFDSSASASPPSA